MAMHRAADPKIDPRHPAMAASQVGGPRLMVEHRILAGADLGLTSDP